MRIRQLLPLSFRTRLRLFFVVIVVVPMVTIAAVLFQLIAASDDSQTDARLAEAVTVSYGVYGEGEDRAGQVAEAMGEDQDLADAVDSGDRQEIQARLEALARRLEARYVELELDGQQPIEVGSTPALALSRRQLADDRGRTIGQITVSVTSPQQYADLVERLTRAHVVVEQAGEQLAVTLPESARVDLPAKGGVELGGDDFRIRSFDARAIPDRVDVRVLLGVHETESPTGGASLLALGAFIAFLALAFVFAVAVSRRLQAEVQRLLEAAQRLGTGDFSVTVPTEGNDEFAALGKEFNSMARQLEARLEDLHRERARLQEAIRRVGESFAAGLDRTGLLEIVVQTAVDGIGASCGRASMRRSPDAPLQEVARAGDPLEFRRALHAAEAAVLDAGQVAEIQIGGTSALAAPLGASEEGDQVIGIVSVARGDRAFTADERELFAYLTSGASVSVENVDLHETVKRQAVTDELTGLFNHRRFQEVISAEVERARRYGHEMGLIMLDIDNFKQVNDTYGHLQGDMVLGEVARVLRQSSREIDEPARYGGEEMAVALPQTDLEGAYQFAERVRRRIEALELPLLTADGTLKVTASFGVASLASAGTADKDALVAAADGALYEAKRAGKNRTVRASAGVSHGRDVHGVASGE
jgi:diguanylate cyclase (GGDEF)-like protein